MNLAQHHQQQDRFMVAAQADHCVRWLKAQGFEVLAISNGPRILIRWTPLCDQFEGAVQGYSRTPKGVERYQTVIRFGCEVRWIVKGGAA